tara:strand:+ start:1315 stop:1779 length:465 start_codon:yes stop_codon:yes gene_type:complete
MTRLATIIASFFGAGYSPLAPGTVGSIAAVLIIYGMSHFVDNLLCTLAILAILSYLFGVWSIGNLPSYWNHDDGKVVIDEAHGIFVSMLFVPYTEINLIIGLVLFRFFDILKPLGIRNIDNLKNDHSVMLDDTAAGICTNIVLQVLIICRILPL